MVLDESLEYISRHYGKKSDVEIARVLGTTIKSVRMMADHLWLLNHKKSGSLWTGEEETYLMENYRKLPIGQLINRLGRTAHAIRDKYKRLKNENKG